MTAPPCPAWCNVDHTEHDSDDGTHFGQFYDPHIELHEPYEGADRQLHPDHFIAVAMQQAGDPEPEVHIGTAQKDDALVLRPDEAEALGYWLIETTAALKARRETHA